MANEVILEMEDVSKSFGGVQAVKDCSFAVKEGLITGLIGPNGAGKTTAFNIISGFYKPDEGRVLLKGHDVTGDKPHLTARHGVSRDFQIPKLFKNLTIEENLLIALGEDEGFWKSFVKSRKTTKKQLKKIREALKKVGLDKPLDTLGSDLSYGQKKLLSVARALLMEHEVLLLDEPTAGVNPKLRKQMRKLLKRLKKEGKTILVIEHDMGFIMDVSDEVIVLETGTTLMSGKPEKVRNDPRVLEAYLGE